MASHAPAPAAAQTALNRTPWSTDPAGAGSSSNSSAAAAACVAASAGAAGSEGGETDTGIGGGGLRVKAATSRGGRACGLVVAPGGTISIRPHLAHLPRF